MSLARSASSTFLLASQVQSPTSLRQSSLLTTCAGDIETISKRLDDSSKNTTVLAPLNSELQKLPRKPWEDPKDYNMMGVDAYKGGDGEDRAHRNLRRFVENHIVPVSPWKKGERVQTVGGGKVWWEDREGTKLVCSSEESHEYDGERNVRLTTYRFNLAILRSRALRIRCRMVKSGS